MACVETTATLLPNPPAMSRVRPHRAGREGWREKRWGGRKEEREAGREPDQKSENENGKALQTKRKGHTRSRAKKSSGAWF